MSSEQDMLREVIREVVRDVIREVIAEELATATDVPPRAAVASGSTKGAGRVDGVITRGVLSERHIQGVGRGGQVTVAKAVVITPLARERAKTLGVEIIRIDG